MKITSKLFAALLLAASAQISRAAELHVAKTGCDTNDGTAAKPYLTIMAAANVAQPGDTITVHTGTYRERINPPRGGESDDKRITYQAAPGEHVEIKGSEVINNWVKVQDDVWKTTLPNKFFGGFNPYSELIHGDWFKPLGPAHHTGAVYLDGEWLTEAATLDAVLKPTGVETGFIMNIATIAANGETGAGAVVPVDRFTAKHGMQTAPCIEGGHCLGFIKDGDWVQYGKFDFGRQAQSVVIRAAAATIGGTIELRLDAPDGKLLGTCNVAPTGGWQKWASCEAKIEPMEGEKTLCLVFKAPTVDRDLWFGQVGENETMIWARFPTGVDPNARQTEINVRQSVFYPNKPGRNYLTVRGFALRDGATPWAPPTAEQIGLIGTNWSRGWVIEDNIISHSCCSGVTLGKYGDQYDNQSADSAEGYVKTIERATVNGWSKDNVGHHLVRHNTISHCEQTGICGSLGGAFSEISGNDISDIHVRRLFSGEEMAGIKLHGSIDVLIRGNRIHRTNRAMWMDWMAQGTRITGNLCYDDAEQDLYMEVNHGPYLIDNNIFLSSKNVLDLSEGGAYCHNLFAGTIVWRPDRKRNTPYLQPHATTVAGYARIDDTDNRFYNNLFVQTGPARTNAGGLSVYDKAQRPLQTGGNIYCGGAQPYLNEKDAVVEVNFHPRLSAVEQDGEVRLTLQVDDALASKRGPVVTTALLGKTGLSKAGYENPDGSSLTINADYFRQPRDGATVQAGPFTSLRAGSLDLQVWPHQ